MERPRPLTGIRVVEFGNLIAAPHAGMLLADLGADVIKVEPLAGDLGRHLGPSKQGEAVFFLSANRGKRSIAIDPKDPDAHHWLVRLIQSSDVVLNNLRRGAMERMGFGWEEIHAVDPGIVYAVVSAFAAEGPDADRAGIDLIFQGESGMMAISGDEGDPPAKTATTIGDYVAGIHTALAISAALVERSATGRGRRVDVSLRDGLLAVQGGWNALFFATGEQPARRGTASVYTAPNETFTTADGHLNVAIVSDRHFTVLCDALDRPDLASDPRYATNEDRMTHRIELAAELNATFATHTTGTWMTTLTGAGLPVGRIRDLGDVFDDPQVVLNEMSVEIEHPTAGRVTVTGSPIRYDGTPAVADTGPPPRLGADGPALLAELGADPAEIQSLVERGSLRLP